MSGRPIRPIGMILGFAILAGPMAAESSAQASMAPKARVAGGGGGVVAVPLDPRLDPDSPEARAYAAFMRRTREIERDLRLIKRRHFGGMRSLERREIGLTKLRAFTDEAAILPMTELFDSEQPDVRSAVLDHFASMRTEAGDTALAWEAIHGEDEWYRARAGEHLAERIEADGKMPGRADAVIRRALLGPDNAAAIAASELASSLKLYEYIPLMATAQIARGGGGGGGRDGTGDLGWIMIGQQTSFVSDLVPVVSNNAVGLDPQIGVVSDGALLRVHDAVVTVYRTEIHRILVGMTTPAWGRSTGELGFDAGEWREWYDNEFVPHLTAESQTAGSLDSDTEPDPAKQRP